MKKSFAKTLRITTVTLTLLAVFACTACAKSTSGNNYYVSTSGSDDNPGTAKKPFKTIQKAVSLATAGDTCYVLAGTYREAVSLKASGRPGNPIRLVAKEPGKVILNGTYVHSGKWKKYKGRIYKTKAVKPVRQLFVDGRMMTEARWPNASFPQDLWTENWWSQTGKGSEYGRIVDDELAKTGIDCSGATAMLNVAHQFFTCTRQVKNHSAGGNSFEYTKSLGYSAAHHAKFPARWYDDRYYLFGILELLDSAGEWFYDKDEKMLYLWLPNDGNPAEHTIEIKQHPYAVIAENQHHITIQGFEFFATAFALKSCNNCIIEDCHLLYPSHSRHLYQRGYEEDGSAAIISGDNNVVEKCSFAYGSASGLAVEGHSNRIENCILHDFSWNVSLRHMPLTVKSSTKKQHGENTILRHNTVFNAGSPCIRVRGHNVIAEYNHLYDGLRGRFGGSLDGAILYTAGIDAAGSVFRFNWVHGAHNGTTPSKWGRGIGIRGDDRTRGLSIHHNVVWNCGGAGILIKGDHNKIHNNTILDIGREGKPIGNSILIDTNTEKNKRDSRNFAKFPPVEEQNIHSKIFNNAAYNLTGSWRGEPYSRNENLGNNYIANGLGLVNIAERDFRPKADSPLVDAGRTIEGITGQFKGKAPDVGAYEYGGEKWVPGADWQDEYQESYCRRVNR